MRGAVKGKRPINTPPASSTADMHSSITQPRGKLEADLKIQRSLNPLGLIAPYKGCPKL